MVRYSTVTSTIRRNFCSNLFYASATKQVPNATCREENIYLTCILIIVKGSMEGIGAGTWKWKLKQSTRGGGA